MAFRYRATSTDATDIWVIDTDGQNAVSLTAEMGLTSIEREPAWSTNGPQGSRIAFVHATATTTLIWSMRPDGIGKRRVTTTSGVRDANPSWAPDGASLVFTRDAKLWVVNHDGSSAYLLTGLGGSQHRPAWSPDGKLIAFASSHEAPIAIYTVWADGSRLARRASGGDYFGNVAWRVR